MIKYPALELLSPEVMEVRAMRMDVDEPHLNWLVGYAPERDEDDLGRVVFGTVHAGAEGGVGEVTVACLMAVSAEDDPGEEFKDLLVQSRALETLWDTARMAFRAAISATEFEVSLPAKAPEPEVSQLVRSTQDDAESEVESDVVGEPLNE
ncbi:hypothetical protein RN51_01322 [Microbacterium oxydans]|uniref:Uncharacterized protein n=1 Tax=Microbacterium oxydans TaxID=82380 RepID=A0A0F0KSB3_9MICO|nr:hypothetical protein [Microbacterium oxydans]KJL23787.1 hypothetical protein RN51_01322 [Microbacterium oxydans]